MSTPSGETRGKIIWEAKRAENWSERWLQKLKDDQRSFKAELAVIVANTQDLSAQQMAEVFVEVARSRHREPSNWEPTGCGDDVTCVVLRVREA